MSGSEPVSVVIPAYNYAHFLPAAVGSILAQDYAHFEIIVVDDGSKDDTRGVMAQFTDPRVRTVWQENAGLSAARNTGIREARNAFVGFLDADDLWEPTFLSRVMAEFARLPERTGAVGTAARLMHADGSVFEGWNYTFGRTGEISSRDFCLKNRPLSSNTVLRKAVFAECGDFDITLRSSEDRDMWIRLTMRGWAFHFLDVPLAKIRRHGSNMSKNAPRMKMNTRRVLLRAWREGSIPRWSPFWLQAFSQHFFQIAWTHRNDGFRARAFAYLLTSLVLWPWFLRPAQLSEPPLFRVRSGARFCWLLLRGK